jgi:hypothetical protein
VRFPVNTLLVNESPTGLFFTTKKLNWQKMSCQTRARQLTTYGR